VNTPSASAQKTSGKIYEIEGLRGVAVIAVILHHLNSEYLPGGYLGVDVFFVISGFVISDLLNKLKFNSTYEYFLIFYVRRIRRLFPALFVFVVVTATFSKLIIDGFGVEIIRTGASALLGVSNLYQIRIGNDYFGLASKFNIFTHTWSLGVEEQFYFIFPLFLYILRKRNLSVVVYLVLCSFLSFLAFVILTYLGEINLQYYLPISRFWEILIGAITYQILSKIRQQKYSYLKKSHMNFYALSLLACFFIPSKIFVYSAPIVCILTALFLLGVGIHKYDPIKLRFLLFTGKISYSLYLYHIPIITIFKLDPSITSISVQFVFLYLISFLSYICIEKPFRAGPESEPKKNVIYAFILASFTAALFMFAISKNTAARDYFSSPKEENFQSCEYNNIDKDKCLLRSKQKNQIFFIGDSHSSALLPLMVKLNEKLGYQIYSLSLGGLYTTKLTSSNHGDLSEGGTKALEFLEHKGKRGDVVVLTNQLMTWFSNTYNDKQEDHRLFLDGEQLTQNQALENYSVEIDQLAKIFEGMGVALIVTAPFPDFKFHPNTCYSPILTKYFENIKVSKKCQTTRKDQEARRNHILKSLKNISDKNNNLYVFDPIDFICTGKICSSIRNGVPLYYDDDHINYITAQYMFPKFKKTLDLINR
jgi:peptidoglycan/LPS O-acetylase OafA/YrhL